MPVRRSQLSTPPVTPARPRMVRRTLQDNVYEYLREALMTGEYPPGQRLTVRGVAAEMGTSVMPVREAFRRLGSEGALEPLSSGAIRVPVYDFAKLQDLTEIRLTVEGLAARRAAKHMKAEEFDALESCTVEIERAVARADFAAEAKANEHFHFVIYRAARSVDLLRIIEHLWLQMGPYLAWLIRQRDMPSRSQGARAFRHHKAIVSGLRSRDADKTERALRADLNTATEVLLRHARNLPPG